MTEQESAQLTALGQSVWIDSMSRDWLDDGTLADLVMHHGVVGVTTNPTIFEQAISSSTSYDDDIRRLAGEGLDDAAIFAELEIADVRAAAEVLAPVYERTGGEDGYVSLELEPGLAYDTEASIARGLELWARVDRPNTMIKVPATGAGLPVIEELLTAGVNVNVTLLFDTAVYSQVVDRYLRALERRRDTNRTTSTVRSVASFFVSRVDTAVDPLLDAIGSAEAAALRGRIAVANAAAAWELAVDVFGSDRFKGLAATGAHVQRPLWASTGTKDATYSDILYVQDLIVPGTINTMPLATLHAFEDHGEARVTLGNPAPYIDLLDRLAALNIDLAAVTAQLTREGVDKFVASYGALIDAIAQTRTVQHS